MIFNDNSTHVSSVANKITGTGTVIQEGANTLILAGANTYSGGTTITAGTLQVGNGTVFGNGTVTDNGALVFNPSSSTVTVANAISGNGSLTQAGSSMLILKGNNSSFTGTIAVNPGDTLQIGTAAATGMIGGSGAITDNGALVFNLTGTTTVANPIGGSGNLTQMSTGTLVLTGNNSYLGTTTVSKGILQIGNGGSTGSLGTGPVTDNATLVFDLFIDPTQDNVISGTGNLTQAGSGILVLTGPNHYGNTTISNGTLEIGTGGSLGNGAVVDNGALLFLNTNSATPVSNKISGIGSVTHSGTDTLTLSGNITGGISLTENSSTGGTLILTGTNAYTGSTLINGTGMLQVGSGGTAGSLGNASAVTDNGSLVFNLGKAVTLGNTLSGNGTVTQASTFALILTGTSTSFTGNVAINNGTVLVNGSLGSTSTVTVSSGAFLGGKGTVGAIIVNGGTVTPGTGGAAGGSLSAASATFNSSSSTLVLYVSSVSKFNQLALTGNLTMNANASLNLNLTGLATKANTTVNAITYSVPSIGSYAFAISVTAGTTTKSPPSGIFGSTYLLTITT